MFESYTLNERGHAEVAKFKTNMAEAAKKVLTLLPENTLETTLFCQKMEEALFYGTKAICSKDGNYNDVIEYQVSIFGKDILNIHYYQIRIIL